MPLRRNILEIFRNVFQGCGPYNYCITCAKPSLEETKRTCQSREAAVFAWSPACHWVSTLLGIKGAHDWCGPGAGNGTCESSVCWQEHQSSCPHLTRHTGPGGQTGKLWEPFGVCWHSQERTVWSSHTSVRPVLHLEEHWDWLQLIYRLFFFFKLVDLLFITFFF